MELNFQLLDHVLAVLKELEAEDIRHAGMQESLQDAEAVLRPLPEAAHVTLLADLTPANLGPDFLTGLATVFAHCEARLSVLYFISCYRLLDLLEIIVDGLNRGRFPRTLLAARSLVEHAAICKWRQRELAPLLDAVNDVKPSTIRKCKGDADRTTSIVEIIFAANLKLEETYGAGRFDRDVFADLSKLKEIELKTGENLRQVGIMKAIDNLSWTGPLIPATNARFYYELLCDYVHPNVGSNFLHVNQEGYKDVFNPVTKSKNRLVHMEMAVDTYDKSLYLHVLSVIIIPVREATKDLIDYTRWLQGCLNSRRQFAVKLAEIGVKDLARQ
jgi:hypothetical protein